jgi:hypothetical protein
VKSETRNANRLVAAAVGGVVLTVIAILIAATYAYDWVLNAVMGGR